MLPDETLKALIEAIIYVAPEPVSLDAIVKALEGEDRERVRAKLEELARQALGSEPALAEPAATSSEAPEPSKELSH